MHDGKRFRLESSFYLVGVLGRRRWGVASAEHFPEQERVSGSSYEHGRGTHLACWINFPVLATLGLLLTYESVQLELRGSSASVSALLKGSESSHLIPFLEHSVQSASPLSDLSHLTLLSLQESQALRNQLLAESTGSLLESSREHKFTRAV